MRLFTPLFLPRRSTRVFAWGSPLPFPRTFWRVELAERDERAKLVHQGDSVELSRFAASQHGLITRDQALAAGMGPAAIGRRLAAGEWRLERTNVYAVATSPVTWMQQILALWLACPSLIISHRSAVTLYGLAVYPDLEVTLLGSSRPRWPDVAIHRVSTLSPKHVRHVQGVPATTPSRTLVDMCACAPISTLRPLVDEMLRRRMTTSGELERVISPIEGRRPKGARLLSDLLREGSISQSPLERTILKWLKEAKLPAPTLQFELVTGGRRVRFDLAYPEHRLAIEVDGYEFHSGRKRFDGDRKRDVLCQLEGWRILRFTSTSSPEFVVEAVKLALGL